MFDCKTLMKLIGFKGKSPYINENEIYEDPEDIFNERQKRWLEYIKTIEPEMPEDEWGMQC